MTARLSTPFKPIADGPAVSSMAPARVCEQIAAALGASGAAELLPFAGNAGDDHALVARCLR